MSDSVVENFRYLEKTLTFEDTKIYYTNDFGETVNVMMDWEAPMMSASAAYVCEGGGDILEIGFGMGMASNYIQSHSIDSHTICEVHPQIITKAQEWAVGKSNVTIVTGSWYSNIELLSTYDGVFWDAGFTSDFLHLSSSISSLVKSGARFTWFNSEYEADNCISISGSSYQEISVSPTSGNDYFDNNIYYMPKKQF